MDRADRAAALEERISRYRVDSAALCRKSIGLKNAITSLLGGGNDNKRRPLHTEFTAIWSGRWVFC